MRLLHDLPPDELPAIAAIGRAIGVEDLVAEAQQLAATTQLDAVLRGEPRDGVVTVDAVAVLEWLTEHCSNLVTTTTLPPSRRFAALGWAVDAGVPVRSDALVDCGEAIASDLDPLPRSTLLDVARRLPELRRGMVRHYARLAAGNRSYAGAAMAGVLAEVLEAEDVAGDEVLAEAWLNQQARVRPEDTVESLVRLTRPAGAVVLTDDLLIDLRPDGWSAVDVHRLVMAFENGRLQVDADLLAVRIDALLNRRPTADDLTALVELSRHLTASPAWTPLLGPHVLSELAELAAVEHELSRRDLPKLKARVRTAGTHSGAVQAFIQARVTPLVIATSTNVREIADLLGGVPPRVVCEHLAAVRRQLGQPVDAGHRIRVAGVMLAHKAVPPEGIALYGGIVDDICRAWSWPDLDGLIAEVRGVSPQHAHNVSQMLAGRGRPTRKEMARERARQKKDRKKGRGAKRSGGWLAKLGLGTGRPPDPSQPVPPYVPPPDR
jgi:hypothetical protein